MERLNQSKYDPDEFFGFAQSIPPEGASGA
jgi:hypothetical protein